MSYSYAGRRHKKKFVRNKCSKFLLMYFLISNAERGMWLCKRKVLKNGQVSKIFKTMGTQMPAMKKKEREKR
jgi:hypothetical protein